MGLEIGTIIDGKYEIEALLGSGGMGVVYRARQINLGRSVAVKMLAGDSTARGAALERFRREAHAVASLRHPNIITIHDVGDADGMGAYIVFELLEGHSLDTEIARRGKLDPHEAIAVARQCCAALAAAHAAGIVHRDLKPSNIFLEKSAHGVTAKVLDFGIAKLRDAEALALDRITAAGAIVGTPAYMSPEQCEGRELDARSDVYSLGCVLFEMLAGRPPFLADSFFAVVRMHASQSPEPPSRFAPGLPSALDDVVLRLLAKQPGDRFSSVADVANALARFGAESAAGEAELAATVVEQLAIGAPDRAATRPTPPNNLRVEVTRFVGRTKELAEIAAVIREARLVTLAGPGGVGKTRLAIEIARAALDWCDEGVWIVDLGPVTEAALVPQAVASALGLREEAGRPIVETLASALRDARTLLVLDGCEHLVEAASTFASELLRASGALRIVATSREVLGVGGELVWPVQPLGVPKGGADATETDAVRLFVDRVRLRDREFAVDERNAALVGRICARLDGIPLAIELAAARARVLSLEQILEKLADRFRLLTGGDRAAPPRRQTLKAALDWSYELLVDDERRVLERLAVFTGGCTLEAAEAVVGDPSFASTDVLDLLVRLVDKSLVVVDSRAGEARYRMLETIREYALERLRESGDETRSGERHTAWFVDLAFRAKPHVDGPEQAMWLERLGAEHDNLRAVLRRAADAGDWETVARLGHALFVFWSTRGFWTEGRDTLLAAVESGHDLPPSVLAGALYTIGSLEERRAEYAAAETHLVRALEIRRRIGETILAASTLRSLGTVHLRRGEIDRATALIEEALAIYREAGDEVRMAWALSGLGLTAMEVGDWDRAQVLMEESLMLSRRTDSVRNAASAIHNLGDIMYRKGDLERAEALARECLEFSIELDYPQLTSFTYVLLATVVAARGDRESARALYEKALSIGRELGDMLTVASALEGMASLAVAAGQARGCLKHLDEAAALRASHGILPTMADRATIDECRRTAEALLDGDGTP